MATQTPRPEPQALNQAALMALVTTGNPVLVGEVRAVKTDTFNYTVKQGPKAGSVATLKKLALTVEAAGAKSVMVETFLPDETDLATYKPRFQKGDTVACILTGLQAVKGEVKANGTVHPYIVTPVTK